MVRRQPASTAMNPPRLEEVVTRTIRQDVGSKQRVLIVITSLKEIDPVVANQVYESMFLGQATGPGAGGKIFKRFRFANTCKRIAPDGFDQLECTQGCLAVDFDPITEVFPELGLEDSFSLLTFQDQVLSGDFPKKKALPEVLELFPRRREAAARSLGSA